MSVQVFGNTLRLGRSGLIWYIVATFMAVAAGGVGLSSLQGNAATLQTFLKDLPPALLSAFKISVSSFASPVGYMAARSLSLIWPLVVIAFAAGNAGAVSGMIERGTIHFELSLPVSRTRWLLSRMLAGVTVLVVMALVTWGSLGLFTPAAWWRFAVLGFAFSLLWLGLAYLVAAFARDRGLVTGVVFGFFGVEYLLSILAGLSDGTRPLERLSVWSAFQPEAAVNSGVPWGTVVGWAVIGLACFAAALWQWQRRDIPA